MASVIPSFAASPSDLSNNVQGSVSFSLSTSSPTCNFQNILDAPFGQYNVLFMHFDSDLANSVSKLGTVHFTLELDVDSDIYLVQRAFVFNSSSDPLKSYRDSENNFYSSSLACSGYDVYLHSNNNFSTTFTGSAVSVGTALHYKNVPAGIYFFTYDLSSVINLNQTIGFGVFVDSHFPDINDFLSEYSSGESSLSETLIKVDDLLDTELSEATSDDERQFIIEKYIYYQEKIISLSDISNKSAVSSSLSEFREVLSDFRDSDKSSSDFVSAVSSLTSSYSDSITSAESAEQTQLLNSSYSIALQELQLEGDRAVGSTIDDIITQDDIDLMSDVEDLEEFLVELDLAEFDSWYEDFSEFGQSIFADSEYQTMREVFEFFLSDDEPFTYFIRWPIFLVLFSIILGTSFIMIRRHSNGSGSVRRSS